jgi:hypothetical protein
MSTPLSKKLPKIPLDSIYVLDKKPKNWLDKSFFVEDIHDINIENTDLKIKVLKFFNLCFNYELLCPKIIVSDNIEMQYDYDSNFVRFIIDSVGISFTYGGLKIPSKSGLLTDPMKQLKVLSKFLYQTISKLQMNEI